MSQPVDIQHKKRRVFFYVDGFNLYYRMLQKKPELKWLCLKTLAQKFMFPRDNVEKIKFFTAKVDPQFTTSSKQKRQINYWDALKSTGVDIIEGVMEQKIRACELPNSHECPKRATFFAWAEKMTDVNLALHVYRDFMDEKPDVICVISADMDIMPALKMVRDTKIPVLIYTYLPSQDEDLLRSRLPQNYQVAMTRRLSESHITQSQFPDKVEIAPSEWRERPSSWAPKMSAWPRA
ncbi:MAG: NYN domain-containing protein [Opitutaceae bacterium]|jgi:uncharacterized LabA/DUF88 family protein